METIIHLMQMHPNFFSNFVQGVVYISSLLLLLNGFWLIFKGFLHLKKFKPHELAHLANQESRPDDPLTVMTAKTLYRAYHEHQGNPYPYSFLIDATRQLAENIFVTNYINKITMISNLLPPMGFIGTIFGMIMIFLAKADPNSNLNTQGLGAALFTTLGALACYVTLEVLKKGLVNLAGLRIESGLSIPLEKEGP